MAVFRLTAVLSTLAILHGFFFHVCQSCSQPEGMWRAPTLVENIIEATSILYGVARNTYPYGHTPTAYTVELEVYCVLKGPKTPLVVNITDAGYIPGFCTSSKYVRGGVYIVLVRIDSGTFHHSQAAGQIRATRENLKNISKACGLNAVTRPERSASIIECPVSVRNCQSETSYMRKFPEPDPVDEIPTKKPDEDANAGYKAMIASCRDICSSCRSIIGHWGRLNKFRGPLLP